MLLILFLPLLCCQFFLLALFLPYTNQPNCYFENGEDDALFIECGYKNKRKAVKKAKELMNQAKSSHLYIDEDIRNKRNPFKNNNWVESEPSIALIENSLTASPTLSRLNAPLSAPFSKILKISSAEKPILAN